LLRGRPGGNISYTSNGEKWLGMSKSGCENCGCHGKRGQKCGLQSYIVSKSAKESLTILIAEDLNLAELVLYR